MIDFQVSGKEPPNTYRVMVLCPCEGWFDVYYGDTCIGSANNRTVALNQANDWLGRHKQ